MEEVAEMFERVRGLIEESGRAREQARQSHLELLATLRERSLLRYSPHDRHYWRLRQAVNRTTEERAVTPSA
jgi:hypothetical protein